VAASALFEELVLKCLDSLYNYALALTRNARDAEDLLGESLARAYERFASYDRSQDFRPWIFTQPAALAESPLHATPLDPEGLLVRRESVEQVREAIRRLPSPLREVVELRDIEGLSYRQIAAVIGCPLGTVMSRLYRGRNLLRTYLLESPRYPEQRTARLNDEL
jgi:RNA polymerase sigma-70 factor (ECF subfamily)